MDLTDKSAQPSMEEILASIRKLLSEESEPKDQVIDFNARPIMLRDEDEEEGSEFDLPAIFKSSSGDRARSERTGASLVRLTDALRSVTSSMVSSDASAKSLRPVDDATRGLSSLKSDDRAFAPAGLDRLGTAAAPSDRSSVFENGHQSIAKESPQAPEVNRMAASSGSGAPEVQRVMAPFKDTKFKALSSPASSDAQDMVRPEPLPQRQPIASESSFTASFEPVAEAAHPVFSPPVETKQSLSASFPQAANAHREEAPQASGVEETAADLLRPMLRNWLAENMPKMVEKALVLEMQQQFGNPKKSGGSDV